MLMFILILGSKAFQVAKMAETASLDLYTVAPEHAKDLVKALEKQARLWQWHPFFKSCAVHKSLDGRRVFAYSRWDPQLDHTKMSTELVEFFAPESFLLEVTAAGGEPEDIRAKGPLTHLAEFRMEPTNQPAMIELTTAALEEAIGTPGLLSATFHRSTDGTRMFNYGQWTNQDAFDELRKKPGFGKDAPYWAGLAKNEFYLYDVECVVST